MFFTAVVMLLDVCSLSFAPPAIIMCVISVLLFTACNCDKNVGAFTYPALFCDMFCTVFAPMYDLNWFAHAFARVDAPVP